MCMCVCEMYAYCKKSTVCDGDLDLVPTGIAWDWDSWESGKNDKMSEKKLDVAVDSTGNSVWSHGEGHKLHPELVPSWG